MTSSATQRTPISILQELCVKKGITPVYELVSSEGPIHEPNYVFLCTAGPFSASSKGTSKKKAKHQASYLVLLKMLASSTIPECDKVMLRDLHSIAANLFTSEFLDSLEIDNPEFAAYRTHRDDEGNFVGLLQELCQKNMWPPPTYEFTSLSQPTHEYHCVARLWKWACEGSGASKKLSKRCAAGALFDRIVSQNLTIPPEALESMEEEHLSLLDREAKMEVREFKVEVETEIKLTTKALRWLCDGNGNRVRLPAMNGHDDAADPCAKLEELASSAKISVLYTYSHMTKSGNIYCLIQLSTTPPHVIRSTAAKCLDVARRSAAARTVLFLNTMCSDAPRMDYDRWFESCLFT
ncbi:RISC-loading complex subunit TARBP2 [Paragonimus westermani]|uniref:RISC-loading complex subunit TARBP2 n=1 Tax=Paragonimus westermani TaxID=34504 RepID=A0A5J4NU19_9TREM|nr:RISC-loading complex subunit TARBP2 [Paragonimus westermani]